MRSGSGRQSTMIAGTVVRRQPVPILMEQVTPCRCFHGLCDIPLGQDTIFHIINCIAAVTADRVNPCIVDGDRQTRMFESVLEFVRTIARPCVNW